MDVKYNIAITKSGAGATEAVADFKAVESAAARANSTLTTNTAAINAVGAATKTATASMRAMQGTLTLIGAQAFPQLTMAAVTAQTAFTGIKTAATAAGVSVAAMSGTLAVITVGLTLAVKAGIEFKNMLEAVGLMKTSNANYESGVGANAEAMRALIMERVAAGHMNLSESEAEQLDRLLSNPSNDRLRMARELANSRTAPGVFMSQGERNAEASRRLSDLARSQAFSDASMAFNNPGAASNQDYQRLNIQQRYNDEIKVYNDLLKDAIISETELRDMTMEADTERMNSLTQLRTQLTDLQVIGERTKELFASGLSTAIVDAFRGGEDAFKQFASTFAAQVAQMILQMQILRALSFLGLSEGGVRFAASGGMFPQFAASGLAGVQSVSSATYFPKFNVVAGEAGREMLTVLARPRMMEIGGIQAAVGNAGPNRLAITNANDLERGGAGGVVDIRVTLGPELRAEIIKQSVEGARVTVAYDMRHDTPISRGVKGLTG